MHNSKILVGNSGDKVFLQGNKVIKEAGHYPEKFKQQMEFLMCCDHPNFIDVKPLSETSYEMKRFPTWYDKILQQPITNSLDQLENLISIIGKFDAVSCWGFVHGDLTVSNILHDKDFLFIDPRGTEEQNYYDYGKLMQSFVMEYESHIYNNLNAKYSKFCREAEKIMYEWCDEYQLKFFLAVHLLGAVPFFELNERYELAGSFLKKGHELFDELEIKYTK